MDQSSIYGSTAKVGGCISISEVSGSFNIINSNISGCDSLLRGGAIYIKADNSSSLNIIDTFINGSTSQSGQFSSEIS